MRQFAKSALQRFGPVALGSTAATWNFYERNKAESALWEDFIYRKYNHPNYPGDTEQHEAMLHATLQSTLNPRLLTRVELLASNVDNQYGVSQFLVEKSSGFGFDVKTVLVHPNRDAQFRTIGEWESEGFGERVGVAASKLRTDFEAFELSHELTHANEYHQIMKSTMLAAFAGVKAMAATAVVSKGLHKLGPRSALLTLPLLGIMQFFDTAFPHRLDANKPKSQQVPRSIRPIFVRMQRELERRADQGAIDKVFTHASPKQAKRILLSTLFVMREKFQPNEVTDDLNAHGHPPMEERADAVEKALRRLSI